MTNEQAIHDLYVIKEFFEEQSGAVPICIEYALEILEKSDSDNGGEVSKC